MNRIMAHHCVVFAVTTLRNTAAKGNCPRERKWHLELCCRCAMGTKQWQAARGVWRFTPKVVQAVGCTPLWMAQGFTCLGVGKPAMH